MAIHTNEPRQRRVLSLTLSIMVLLELGVAVICRGPAPKSEHVPDTEFSAARARMIHEQILPAEPHPVGSLPNQLVRERLVNVLQELGLEVETDEGVFPIEQSQASIRLVNLLARLPGPASSLRPLVLATHYDSVPQGPGAGDAGVCVAALVETARALRNVTELKRPVYLLITDGEERGLWGAQSFVKHHPLAVQKPFVINMDARGSSGPCLMFETQRGNRNAIEFVAPHLAWPRLTNSIFVLVYRLLPNGTDFTVFNNDGWQGINFACIDGAHVYHTPLDTLANLSQRTQQHYGDHLFNVARAFASRTDEIPDTTENAVFFDLLGVVVVAYPASFSVGLQLAATSLVLVGSGIRRRTAGEFRTLLLAMAGTVLLIVVSSLAGFLTSKVLSSIGIIDRNLTANIKWVMLCYFLVTLISVLGISSILFRRFSSESLWNAVWIGWSINGLIVAYAIPEASVVCLLPTFLAGLLSLSRLPPDLRSFFASIGTSLLLLPTLHLFPIALGASPGYAICPAYVLVLLPLCPILGQSNGESNKPCRL